MSLVDNAFLHGEIRVKMMERRYIEEKWKDEVDKGGRVSCNGAGGTTTMMGLKERAFARDPSQCLWRNWFPRSIFTGMYKKSWISRLCMIWFASAMQLPDAPLLTRWCFSNCNSSCFLKISAPNA